MPIKGILLDIPDGQFLSDAQELSHVGMYMSSLELYDQYVFSQTASEDRLGEDLYDLSFSLDTQFQLQYSEVSEVDQVGMN